MNTKANIEMARMRSLMERMERVHTNYQATLNEQRYLNEANGVKKAVTRDQIIDILEDQDKKGNGGLFATLVYATARPVYKTKRKGTWRGDEVNKMLDDTREEFGETEWHKSLTSYNADDVKSSAPNPITSVLAVTKYQIHWTTKDNYNKAWGDYSNNLRNLRMQYGVGIESDGMLGDNMNQRQDMGGFQANQTGNLSKDFNMASAVEKDSKLYLVNAEGNVTGEIPDKAVKAMSTPYKAPAPEKAMRDALTDEELKAYMEAKAELDKKFKSRTLNFDGILAIVASVDGISYYYINDKGALSGKAAFDVNPQDLLKIAEESIGEKFQPMTGFAN